MRSFAPEPGDTVDITAMRLLQNLRWQGPRHAASWRADPLAAISTILLAIGSVMLFCAILALAAIGAYVFIL